MEKIKTMTRAFPKVLGIEYVEKITTILTNPSFFYKFQCGLCNESHYGESIRHLDIRSGEHIGASPLTGKKVKPSSNSAICDHLLHCNFLPSFDNFWQLKCFSSWKQKVFIRN